MLVENFRPGTLAKLGLDYASLRRGIRGSSTARSPASARPGRGAERPGYDAVMQAEGGLMSITGAADGPPFRLGVAIADIVSGMFAAQGITAALFARERTGRGQAVDIAMLDSVAALLTYQAGIYFATGAAPGRMGNRHPTIVPYETFARVRRRVRARGRQRRSVAALLRRGRTSTPDERFATNRQRVTGYDELQADPRRAARRRAARVLDRAAHRGRRPVRIGARSARGVCRSAARSARA